MTEPIQKKLMINTYTNGKSRIETLDGREYLVISAVPIEGDTVMNGGFYPDDEVEKSFNQLSDLPAPYGHPEVNGENVSAFHPLAFNAYGVGALIRNPVKNGKTVRLDIYIDKEISNSLERGRELLKRIGNKDKIGVSTGLMLFQMEVKSEYNGQAYDWIGLDYMYDHLAILRADEEPAGGDTTTVDNSAAYDMRNLKEYNDIMVVNYKATESNQEPLGGNTMAETPEKKVANDNVAEKGAIQVREFTAPEAQELLKNKGLLTHKEIDDADIQHFIGNKAEYKALWAKEDGKVNELRAEVVKNSEFTAEEIATWNVDALNKILAVVKPAPASDNTLRTSQNAETKVNADFVYNFADPKTKEGE